MVERGHFRRVIRVVRHDDLRRWRISSSIEIIVSSCWAANRRRSGSRAMVPSSFRISQRTPISRSPARRARSMDASV